MNTVVSQALATGLPVLATRHSGLPEQVIEGKNGYLVPEGDYVALAERLLALLDDPTALSLMSREARDHVHRHYDSEKLIGEQIDAYERVVASSQPET